MAKTYGKCVICGVKFEVKDWHKGCERKANMLCLVKFTTVKRFFPKVAKIIDYKLGLNYPKEQSYEDTAEHFGISRQEVAKCETLFKEMCNYLHHPEKMEKWHHNEAVQEVEMKLLAFEKTLKIKQ
jgi:hypothetical protein